MNWLESLPYEEQEISGIDENIQSKTTNTNLDENYVRLINAKGEWRLSHIDNKLIEVSYLWNGELRGGFPSWSLSKAWIKHANEVLGNLKTKLEENNVQ